MICILSNAYKGGRWSFRSDTPNLQYASKNTELMEQKAPIDSLIGVSRFSRLLRSLRTSRQNSPESHTSNSW